MPRSRVYVAKHTDNNLRIRYLYPSRFSQITVRARSFVPLREAESNLEKLTFHRRRVHNHNQIRLLTDTGGDVLAKENLETPNQSYCAPPVPELVVQVDGILIPFKEKEKHSFEALSAVVYRLENIREIDKHHLEIESKSCALSAKADGQVSINIYILNAARKQGLVDDTEMTVLADGTKKCWSALSSLENHCKQLTGILDWWHIGKNFQGVRGGRIQGNAGKHQVELWNSKTEEALTNLELLMNIVTDSKACNKLENRYKYLKKNQDYLVNYE